MAIEKFRTRIFTTTNLTVSGTFTATGPTTNSGVVTQTGTLNAGSAVFIAPYQTTAPTQATNGQITIAHVGGTASLRIRSGGSTFVIALPTAAAGGSITTTSS